MGVRLYADNAKATLAAGISSSDLTGSVAAGLGALFPSPTGGDYFVLTLTQGTGTETSWERVHVTARSGDVMTWTRAQEGSTAAAWASGSKAELRLTADSPTAFETHRASTSNPHSTTAAQVGAIPTSAEGAASGVATLDAAAKRTVSEAQPSKTLTYTTASMSPGQTDSAATLALNKISTIYAIQVSRAAWVRIYQTAAARAADLARDISNDPASGSGVVGEVYLTSASTIYLAPTWGFFNADGSPSDTAYLAITNKDVNSGTVAVTVTFRPEA